MGLRLYMYIQHLAGLDKNTQFFLPSSGGSQLMFASTWESKKMTTSPEAARAPSSRVRINPSLLFALTTFTLSNFFFTYSSS